MDRALAGELDSSRCFYGRRLGIYSLVGVVALAAPSAIASNPGNPEIRATATARVNIGLSVRPTLSITPTKFGQTSGTSDQTHLCLRSNSFQETYNLRFEEGRQALTQEKLVGSGAHSCQVVYTLPEKLRSPIENGTLVVIITPQ